MKEKVFITKYALTKGIIECEMTPVSYKNEEEYMYGSPDPKIISPGVYYKKDYSLNREDAIKQSYELRDKKIKNLEKQIEKLKNLTFK